MTMKLGKDGQNSGAFTGPKVSSPLDYDCKNGCKIPISGIRKTENQRRELKSLTPSLSKQGHPSPLSKGSTDNGDQ